MKKALLAKSLRAGLIVGTLDILAAFIHFYFKTGKNPILVLKFIASGIFGNDAFVGGYEMAFSGLILHYIIAISFSIFFFWLAIIIPAMLKNRIISGILYGVFIWCTMQFIVLPLSNTPKLTFSLSNSIIAILILIFCIGLPLTFMASKK